MVKWKKGDLVTAEDLNRIENKVAQGSGIAVFHTTYDTQTNSMSSINYNDFIAAINNNQVPVLFIYHDGTTLLYCSNTKFNDSSEEVIYYFGEFVLFPDGSIVLPPS